MSRRKNDALFSAHAVFAALHGSIRLLLIGMAVMVLAYLASNVTVVGPNEVGLIMRFGKLERWVHPPGLLVALPAPIDEVIKVPVKTVQETSMDLWSANAKENDSSLNPVTQGYSLTGDVNIVRARFVVRYRASDPFDYVLNSRDRDQLRDAILYECACQALASAKVDDALTSRRYEIAAETMRLAQEKITRLKLGLQLVAFDVREINPPRSVIASFQSVITAKLQARTLVEQANAYAASELPAAQAEAFRTQQETEGFTSQIVDRAGGESTAFLAQLPEYRAHPGLVRARLINDMRQAVLPQVKGLSIMPGSGTGSILLAPGGTP